ncbi:methylenetetrahydrofolate reductase [Hymenobacter caeli]|uniref:Methylenetetrahydrofolate reductase n=1 Tax=Hymenobacter caeli TaxID=2735894 RepID=A0ABX2FM29_9BACT|nr:methylenetetrahydrofolate reductase [Hymenobacter caeli]NRT18192.1 methylenetetrahydrofolate reductase (NADPH) [Hymenobacter caeli]
METLTKKRTFAELLASDKFIVSAELTPPRHFDTTKFMEAAGIVSEYVDVVQLNDHLLSRARLSNLVAGMHCKNAGLEPILQFTLRHRNRIALQGDLLGFANLGLENVIILGGYPCAIGTDPEARDATDLGSVEAIASITALTREGKMFNGDVIKPAPKFTVGTIDFPCATDKIEDSMKRLTEKIDAGARYIQVQAIFELGPMQFWMAEVVRRGLHRRARFLAAIFPFSGAERLHVLREIPGLSIPDHLLARVEGHNSERESLAITLELINGIRDIEGISGLHIRSIGAEDWVPRIIEAAGLGGELVY